MQLRKRGSRPQLGDSVVIAKADDPRDGEEATVVQDDRDAQPFRLRFADSELSMVFYREYHVKLSEATRRRRAEEEAEQLKLQQGEDDEEEPPEIVISDVTSAGRSPLPSHSTPPSATPRADGEQVEGQEVELATAATAVTAATTSATAAVTSATATSTAAATAAAAAQKREQVADAKVEEAAAVAPAATTAAAATAAAATAAATATEVVLAEADAALAAAAEAEAALAAAAAAPKEVGRDLGGGRDSDALFERLPVATNSAAAEGHADEAAACTYSRHAWLLSNPVGVPHDLSATEQGASTVAATLGRADGVPVDPPGLVPHKP